MHKGWWVAGLAVALGPACAGGQEVRYDPTDPAWTLRQDVEVVDYQRASAFRMVNGQAVLTEADFQDGTIEFDVAMTGLRSFVYVQFRIQPDNGREDFYLRPHKSSLPDAAQYTPVIGAGTQWQLHHAEGGTAAVPLPVDEWVHVRVVVSGRQAALFVGDQRQPAIVAQLVREPRPGGIALRGFVPEGSAAPQSAHFANLVVKPGVVSYDFPPPKQKDLPQGTITRWSVSEAFETSVSDAPGAAYLGPVLDAEPSGFRTVDTADRGMLDFHALLRPERMDGAWTTVASVGIRAAADTRRRLRLGFSDAVTVFLNGNPILHLDHSYSYDDPMRAGLFYPGQATVFLDLREGENELSIVVADVFGGWALYGELDSLDGLTLTP